MSAVEPATSPAKMRPTTLTATVHKAFDLPAAHANLHHGGGCSRIHGHTWTLELFVRGTVVDDPERTDFGMVVDFADIKRAYRERIEPHVEHQFLNETLAEFELPEMTTEWIVWWAFMQLRPALPQLVKARLWEGRTSYAEIEA